MVYAIEHQIPPFHFIELGGRHIHHLVFGIIILLLVGYGWLSEIGTGADDSSIFLSRLMSILYGVSARDPLTYICAVTLMAAVASAPAKGWHCRRSLVGGMSSISSAT